MKIRDIDGPVAPITLLLQILAEAEEFSDDKRGGPGYR
jgi:hypothetical protein